MAMKKLGDLLERGSENFTQRTPEEYEQMKADAYNKQEGNLHTLDGYNCDKCKNKGYIAFVKDCGMYYSETLMECKCMTVRAAINRLKRSGLKNIVKDYTLKKYEVREQWQASLKEAAERFIGEDVKNHWFFIGGQSGAGKTHLCTAIAVHYIKAGYDMRYMLWMDEITRIKPLANTEEHNTLMDELKKAKVLYIDDLFKMGKDDQGNVKNPTAADVAHAFEILNYRYINPDLITIISSERTIAELCQIDEALAGRISERTKAEGYCLNIKRNPERNWRLKDIQEI